MPWDDVNRWEDGLRLLVFLERLLIRSSRSLGERPNENWLGPVQPKHEVLESVRHCQREDDQVRQWLLVSPPHLTDVIVWTKAFAGGVKGERMVAWQRDIMGFQWHKGFDQPIEGGEVDRGAFV
jgi:hypothetical protein